MGFTLVVSEKRETAERIAGALDENGKPRRYWNEGVPYFEAFRRGRTIRIVAAVGHLYTIAPKEKTCDPVLDLEWVPAYRFNKRLAYTKRWIEAIKKASRGASAFVSATDYDVEGELIGYTILRYTCGEKDKEARRMIFSSLTKEELQKAFENLSPTLNFKLVEAGETRHIVDFLWGINVSRALTLSLRKTGRGFTRLSAGRVQGPTLAFIAEREKAINGFVPTPYWKVFATLEVERRLYKVHYLRPRIPTLKEAQKVLRNCESKQGTVKSIEAETCVEAPPPPFNLESLQSESYRAFRHTPSRTLRMAESLYLAALISYPRTSSEKIPPTVDCEEILSLLSQIGEYKEHASELLRNRPLHPNRGRGEDPAHPAIYPTGNRPGRSLEKQHARLLDMVVRRFLSSLAPPTVTENIRMTLDLNGELFSLAGRRIIGEGWLGFYAPYLTREESPAPALHEGERVRFNEIRYAEAFTSPPSRFNPASLLRMMEEQGLGTKATRGDIIDTLGDRGYVTGESMTLTELGLGVYETLRKCCPALVSVGFTRDLERKMDAIQRGEGRKEEVVGGTFARLNKALDTFSNNQIAIVENLSKALYTSYCLKRTIGPCPICHKGQLLIVSSKRTGKRFAGCSNHMDGKCTATFPLPQPPYKIWTNRKTCQACSWPTVSVKSPNRWRPWSLCLNPACPAKT